MEKKNVYQMVTDRIIEQLEQGIIPWQRPWHGTLDGAVSYTTGRPYSLLNQMLLGDPVEYLTFKQIKELGGTIKKGAKAKIVVFYKPLVIKKEETSNAGDVESKSAVKTIPMLRYYNVFSINDTEGIESKRKDIEQPTVEPIKRAEQIIDRYLKDDGPESVVKKSNEAYYSPLEDLVVVPLMSQFDVAEEFYSTAFHELVHSTSHRKRCNRCNSTLARFGDDNYSFEELVAEIGSAMLLNISGIDTEKCFKNNVGYIQGWLRKFKSDNRMIVQASSKSEKAVKWILGDKNGDQQE